MEQWNNVELTNLSKKSYTLNHAYDATAKYGIVHDGDNEAKENGANGDAKTGQELPGKPHEHDVLQPGSNIKPQVKLEDVESLLRRLYGIIISEMKELISYDDRNFFIKPDSNIKNPIITSHWPHGYVLKILNSLDSKKTDFIDGQNELMIYLAKSGIQCPRPVANVNGKFFSVEHINGRDHVVRLLEYIPGDIFHQVEKTNYLLFQSGEYLAKIDRALKKFHHDAYDTRKSLWMLHSVPQLKEFLFALQDHARKAMIEEIMEAFEKHVLSQLSSMEMQIVHGDYNEQNIVVEKRSPDVDEYHVSGIIDFGDTNKSPIIFEVGIALTYMMLQTKSLESGGIFLAGYTSIRPISGEEKALLKYCVAARLAQSLVLGAYTHSLDPTNDYVLVTQEEGWKLIEQLWREGFGSVDELWQNSGDKYLTQSVK